MKETKVRYYEDGVTPVDPVLVEVSDLFINTKKEGMGWFYEEIAILYRDSQLDMASFKEAMEDLANYKFPEHLFK